jgi:RNA polymerase sigma-70 factor (ECF subfamily)
MTVYPQTKTGEDSWDLVRAAQAGDREAFGQLYARYQPQVQGLLRGKVRDRVLIEDLTSETFLRALRRIDSVSEQREDPGAWLSTIARNLVLDHARSARTRLDRTTDQIPEPRGADRAEQDAEAQAEARADRAAAAATVARVLERLPADQRRAVRVRDLDEVSLAETAARMGRSETSVKGLRWRAMAAMREQLAAEGLTSTRECAEAVARAEAAVARLRHERVEGHRAGSDAARGRHRSDQRETAEQRGRRDGRVDGWVNGSEDGRESGAEFDVLGGAA